MRYLFGFLSVCALGLVPLVGCSETAGDGGTGGTAGMGGAGGSVTETIEQMLVGRWWLDWDKGAATPGGIGLATFTADGWVNYDVKFPVGVPGVTEWCRRYANWSLFEVVSETEFGYVQTYTHDTCNREVGWTEQFKVVWDQMNPPKGEVTRLSSTLPGIEGEFTIPIERCTTDINAAEACTFDTGLGAPTQIPPTVELNLTLQVVGTGPDFPTRVPLEGAAFCELDNTDNCDVTDTLGLATIEVIVPADKRIGYTFTKDGYLSFLYTDVVDDMLYNDGPRWTSTDETAAEQAALMLTPYPYEGTGTVAVEVFETGTGDRSGKTFELVGAADEPFYFDTNDLPSPDLTSTSTRGLGVFVEVAPGEVEIRLGGTATNCVAVGGWPGSEANTLRVPVKAGFASWSSIVCDAP